MPAFTGSGRTRFSLPGKKRTRREFLKLAGLGTAGLSSTYLAGCEIRARSAETTVSEAASAVQKTAPMTTPTAGSYVQAFRSRPDLRPPVITVSTPPRDTAPGYVFIAPKKSLEGQYGSMVLDEQGRMVWFKPVDNEGHYPMDCKVQTYKGEPVLTFWEGLVQAGYGSGEYRILDRSYNEIARVRAEGFEGDHHDFLITSRDTALVMIYNPVGADLSGIGRQPEDGIVEGVVQEIDVASGEVLFEWHSLDHVRIEESYVDPLERLSLPYDYFHINSVEVDEDENLIISAKGVNAVYKIDRTTGEVIWRLGGKQSDFEMGPNTRFVRQHDARRRADGTITLFDNGEPQTYTESSGKVLALNTDDMTAELAQSYTHPDVIYADHQANMQTLPNGNVFIGWGSVSSFSEFSSDGQLLYSADLPPETESYRAFRFPWEGRPGEKPAVASESGQNGETTLYVGWNGATEVTGWQVLAGPSPDRLQPAGSVPRKGFETAVSVDTTEPYVSVRGKDPAGKVLGASEAIEL